MSAESIRVTKTEVWTEWENRIINGVFPLRRFLGGSNHSAVFLTDYRAENLSDVAIKFVPADTLQTEVQLVQWGAAATFSHPHLLRMFDVGRCHVRGRGYLFVVMEYAEQTLAQILPKRALNPDEVREMLLPTLDALSFLHRNQLVHGQLKPSNFLVVNDQLKLASDSIRPTGNSASGIVRTTVYDPPELKDGVISPAGDIWGLGMTLVEALTQRTPTWPDERAETASLPAIFPAPFVDTVRRCLSRTPANRPTVNELETQYKPAPQAPVIPVPQPPAHEAPREATPPQNSPKRHVLVPAISAVLVVSLAVWVGLRFFQKHPSSMQSTSSTSQVDSQPAAPPAVAAPALAAAAIAAPAVATPAVATTAVAAHAVPAAAAAPAIAKSSESNSELPSPDSRPPAQPSLPPADTSLAVPHKVTPDVSRVIQDRIRGHIKVKVRVLVDPAGNVVGEFLENPGPSRYFARLAGEAAGEWKFAPADTQGSRVWLLRFEFNRGGVTVDATAAQ
jgi:serine/threonine protein kinase